MGGASGRCGYNRKKARYHALNHVVNNVNNGKGFMVEWCMCAYVCMHMKYMNVLYVCM